MKKVGSARRTISMMLTVVLLLATVVFPAVPAIALPEEGIVAGHKLPCTPVPGDLAFYGSINNWVKCMGCGGIDTSKPCCVKTGVEDGKGFVTVKDCPVCDIDVGYAFADAKGKLTLNIDDLGLAPIKEGAGLGISAKDVRKILTGVVISGNINDSYKLGPISIPFSFNFTLDIGAGTGSVTFPTFGITTSITIDYDTGTISMPLTGNSTIDGIIGSIATAALEGVVKDIVGFFNSEENLFALPLDVLNPLLAQIPRYSGSLFSIPVPYSFGYAYKGELVNGKSAILDADAAGGAARFSYLEKSFTHTGYLGDFSCALPEHVQCITGNVGDRIWETIISGVANINLSGLNLGNLGSLGLGSLGLGDLGGILDGLGGI